MPNINEAFPSKYLKASDLKGAEPIVIMDRVEYEPVGQDKEMKAVLYFKGKNKGLVLNKTNANKIIQLAQSPVTEDWEGQQIKLYPTETSFGGEMVDCIRVKAATRNGQRQTPAPAPRPVAPPPPVEEDFVAGELTDDDIPF